MGVQVVGYVTDNSQGSLVVSRLDNSWRDGWGDEGWTVEGESWVGNGVVELSNTDVGQSLVDLILASDQFLANASVLDTADNLLGELVYLGRRRD